MEATPLEQQILSALEEEELAEKRKPLVSYKPQDTGEGYRRMRSWFFRNSDSIAWGTIATAGIGIGGIAYFNPQLAGKVAAGVGAVGVLGGLLHAGQVVDRFLSVDPNQVAQAYFRKLNVPWEQAYDLVQFGSRRELEGFVMMAQTSDAIRQTFPHDDYQLTLGVATAATADRLSETKANGTLSGLYLDNLIDMMTRQKIGKPEDTETLKRLRQEHTPAQLAKAIQRMDYYEPRADGEKWRNRRAKRKFAEIVQDFPGIQVLRRHIQNYEFGLMISDVDNLDSVGSQLSKGCLRVKNSVGDNAGCYAGKYSKDKDLPRYYVGKNCGKQFMTHATRGLGVVKGDAGIQALEKATGGIVIVEGLAEHSFAAGMDDKNYPVIGICYEGLRVSPQRGYARNGLIVDLGRSNLLANPQSGVYKFRDGEMYKRKFETDNPMKELGVIVREYINKWNLRHSIL